ncbi:MAG: helix-turn-helix transcriptional regulator [Clostridiales bacterium]|nr:helix-turn-helix transcriptional regulator [Clostridiales bacterium]
MDKISMKAARVNAGLTQVEIAKRIGKSDATVLAWEKGRKSPRIEEFEAYCRECGVDPEKVKV